MDIDVEVDVFWLCTGGFKVSSGTVESYRSSYGADFETSEIASPVIEEILEASASES